MFLKLFSRSKPPSDQELVEQYQQTGDVDCVGELFQRYTEMVYLVCLKYLKQEEESKDATMQIFENLLVSLRKHEVANFKSWLHSTARNHCLMLLRSRRNRLEAPLDESNPAQLETAAWALTITEQEPEQEQMLQVLEAGLVTLGPEQRICLELFFLQQQSYKEIAERTGFELAKVKSHIQNGKRNLMIYMKKNYEQ
ncbi:MULTISPECIES: RNA polymerase sigma factor [Rufibacter]|uniref:RNA polymerase sigma-70 factor (ECF subfamily) n=1 Tax=Rufibacter quisquiliarum TaxID=1549639 RepID=A0A839GKM1_9BACT|nr:MULTISPECIES: sigma-70 family RNA polymerase sigma factor [Rufibacter]MBA9079210.1 RNA polymerase sigma-70 factor (ECF subfamily) [Rufibacter quisquiliarum]